ncbi:hypothetical protein QJS10_CPA09g01209 [Acorus calamus]|uniref:THH1/TOM1/TOM3 domain-containing protein n=1 Tax=Acorus calamus TaxID=4465 RepID=A0AAV9E818_ACOCL|nr:hypothetical protein QJS10_CPA09g01209 [Acorus calamus]
MTELPLEGAAAVAAPQDWWSQINGSTEWQDGIFYSLCAAYAFVAVVALIQLIRIQLRVPEYCWTTQKVFHFMNFIVNGVRAVIFGFHKQDFLFRPRVFTLMLLDLPGILFFSTYSLLVLLWAEIYHQARSLPTDKLRIIYISVNGVIYFIQVGSVTTICFTCFLIRCIVVGVSAFFADASLDVLDHPILNLVYYTLSEILPSALVLYILRKLPSKRVSAQYHPIH